MDSMRSLNKSLPSSNSNRPPPPEQLLQAFRTAALSVTNLYKSAVTDQSNSRHEGYQDALDDLLAFLDRENLGLQDGEGWSVRQWATERYERSTVGSNQNESDDERVDEDKDQRCTSPARSHNSSEGVQNNESRSITPAAPESEPVADPPPPESTLPAQAPIYRFIGVSPPPSDTTMHVVDSSPSAHHTQPGSSSQTSTDPPIRIELVNQGSRPTHRSSNSRHNIRTSARDFTFTSGTKRKVQFPDFFDISNLGSGREGHGGGKRGRFA